MLAVGGTGGRKIPNGLLEVLTQFIVLGQPLAVSLAAPRLHTEGDAAVFLEKHWPAAESKELSRFGYTVGTARSANINGIAFENGSLSPGRR